MTQFNRTNLIRTLSILVFALGLNLTSVQAQQIVPVIKKVGVIPTTWQGSDAYGLEILNKNSTDITRELMNDSQRFHMINKNIVINLWTNNEGRDELNAKYELDSYVHMTIAPKPDFVQVTARLLSKDLETQLQESQAYPRDELTYKSVKELREELRPLVFRMLNRLPVDVNVTSIQGGYMTISGGENQSISVGDTLNIIRATIQSTNPANGSWNSFKTKPMGQAVVIETKTSVAVAKVTSQIREGLIRVGDGATIKGMSARRLFVRQEAELATSDNSSANLVIPAISKDPEPAVSEAPPKPEKVSQTSAPATQPTQEQPKTSASEPSEPASEPAAAPVAAEQTTDGDASEAPTPVSSLADLILESEKNELRIRYSHWSLTGPVSAESKFNYIPLNEIEAATTRRFSEYYRYRIKAMLGYGHTDASNYFAYTLGGSGYTFWKLKNKLAFADLVKAGVNAELDGRAVGSGAYGGNDLVSIGFFAGLEGETKMDSTRLAVDMSFTYTPIVFGRVGYNGSQKSVDSASGWNFAMEIVALDDLQPINWGGGFSYGSTDLSMEDGNRISIDEANFEVIGRIRF